MSERYLIYGLVDPEKNIIRYIGKSSSGLKRPKCHYKNSFKKNENGSWKCDLHVNRWIRKINKEPIIDILEDFEKDIVTRDMLNGAERSWIAYFKLIGRDLTNIMPGGDGGALYGNKNPFYGKHHTEETLNKLRKQSGKNHPMYGKPGTMLGKKHNLKSIEKMRKSHKGLQSGKKHGMWGKKLSDYHRKRISCQVICINDGLIFSSLKEAASHYNISPSSVSAVITGRYQKTFNLVFEKYYE